MIAELSSAFPTGLEHHAQSVSLIDDGQPSVPGGCFLERDTLSAAILRLRPRYPRASVPVLAVLWAKMYGFRIIAASLPQRFCWIGNSPSPLMKRVWRSIQRTGARLACTFRTRDVGQAPRTRSSGCVGQSVTISIRFWKLSRSTCRRRLQRCAAMPPSTSITSHLRSRRPLPARVANWTAMSGFSRRQRPGRMASPILCTLRSARVRAAAVATFEGPAVSITKQANTAASAQRVRLLKSAAECAAECCISTLKR